MALPDDEQRRLAEIERGLAEDDPRLARRFDGGQPPLAAVIAGALMLSAGLVFIVVGARLGAPLVILTGVLIAAILPVMAWSARP